MEFINFKQGKLSVIEYYLKFTQLYKHVPPIIVANPSVLMNRFMKGVFELAKEVCGTTMLVHDMDISRLVVFS